MNGLGREYDDDDSDEHRHGHDDGRGSGHRGRGRGGRARGGGGGGGEGGGRGRGNGNGSGTRGGSSSGRGSGGRGRGAQRARAVESGMPDDNAWRGHDDEEEEMEMRYRRRREAAANGQAVNQAPHRSWSTYFPDADYMPDLPHVDFIRVFKRYILDNFDKFPKEDVEMHNYINISFVHLHSKCQELATLASETRNNPNLVLSCLGLAVHEVFREQRELENQQLMNESGVEMERDVQEASIAAEPRINVRLMHLEPVTLFRDIKANLIGKLVSVVGTVVRVSNVRPLVYKAGFMCVKCQQAFSVYFPDGKYKSPQRCVVKGCKSKLFEMQRDSILTETVDWQKIRLQEISDDDEIETGRVPRTLEVELTNDLIDKMTPGDVVSVVGIVKILNTEDGIGRSKSIYVLYLDGISVSNIRSNAKRADSANDGSIAKEDKKGDMQFSIRDMYGIREIASDPEVFRLIVNSLCPSIFGHEMVKAGMLLALFGGRRRNVGDKNKVAIRGDPHVLIVGDPGLGKSQMLTAASALAPRGVFVCGNATTTSGLTVSISREQGPSNGFCLEAGALVLADQGVCCIDEFDKMTADPAALLEAMEQQSISIAKAGIVASLPARTAILAAANPVGGHYNKGKTVSENLRLSPALLSRFDLVFILLDKADAEMDMLLSEHVMAAHSGRAKSKLSMSKLEQRNEAAQDDPSLRNKLKLKPGESLDPIPPSLLRKYINYARKYVQPKLTQEAATVLQQFYLNLRQKHRSLDSTPITTRQLESAIRLSEARARLELREEVTAQDAADVVEIMQTSLFDTASDEVGNLDFSRSQNGSGSSKRAESIRFVAELTRLAQTSTSSIFSYQQLYKIATDMKIKVTNFQDFVDSLNNQSYLLSKGNRMYKLATTT